MHETTNIQGHPVHAPVVVCRGLTKSYGSGETKTLALPAST